MPQATALGFADHRVAFIRHGESVHNAAYVMEQEPADGLIDAPLSARGRRQALALRETLRMTNAELVITSPLTRAIETALILFPAPTTRIIVTDLLSELIAHPCDIRRSPPLLAADFPGLDFSLLRPDEHGGSVAGSGFAPEAMECLDSRCREFLSWLLATHPKASAVVGHGTYFERLLGMQLDNCGQTFVSVRRLQSILTVAP